MKKLLYAFLFILILAFSGCGSKQTESVSKTGFYFDTVISITLYGTDDASAIDGAFELCRRYERIFSRTDKASELFMINASRESSFNISDTLSEAIEQGFYYSSLSGGAFDITLEPVTSLWNLSSDTPVIPDSSLISEALAHTGAGIYSLSGNVLQKNDPDAGIDLGGIAKGYIADRVKEYLIEQGITSAYINLGGNTLCLNQKPDGTPFRIGIQYPFEAQGELIEILNINNLSVVTAGSYNRCFTKDGVLYHHILNPQTGYPVNNNLVSVTIVSESSVEGDALSTSCFVLGLEDGLKLVESLNNVYAMFITEDYEIHYSEGFEQFID